VSPAPAAADRAATVAAARAIIAKGSKSFAAASKLFDPVTRERACLLYAWCRRCDDLADGQEMGHGMAPVADPAARLALIRSQTEAALAGEPVADPAFAAIGLVARETRMPRRFVDDLIAGFALDAEDWRPRTEADLHRYCYHVAGVVGCMMAVVMGVDPDDEATLDRACDLGLAFQLANIARDLMEDDAAARCYLPVEWLVEMDIPPGQHMKPPYRKRLTVLARRLADRAAAYEESARVGTRALSYRSAWAVLAAAGIYGGIARKVAAAGEHAWDHRVHTTRAEKLAHVARAAAQAARRHQIASVSRDGLWSRPR
jgi:phytoene synthase